MIQAFFFDLQAVQRRPQPARGPRADVGRRRSSCSAPGMMGAAIAYVCAKAGIEVVLKDVSQEAADKGKDYSRKLVDKGVERGKTTQEKGDALLALITPTDRPGGGRRRRPRHRGRVRGPEGQGRGVRRDRAAPGAGRAARLEHVDAADHRSGRGRLAAGGLHRPALLQPGRQDAAAGDHQGREDRGRAALYRALDFAKQIAKTPIVVNDSRGFFTSRVIGTFINEAISMLAEGVPAASIEQASSQAGYPAPVAAAQRRAQPQADAARSATRPRPRPRPTAWVEHPAEAVIDRMVDEFERPGKLDGAGFYEYADGKRTRPLARAARGLPVRSTTRPRSRCATCRSGCCSSRRSRASSASTRASSSRSPTPTSARSWASASPAGPAACCSTSTATRAACRASWPAPASWPSSYGERFTPPESLVARAERGETYSDEEALAAV